jgi:hypothetical protein
MACLGGPVFCLIGHHMKIKNTARSGLLAAVLLQALQAQAGTAWNEDTRGDLSNDGLAPTLVSMGVGNNDMLGTVGNAGLGVDRDYFSFNVAAGTRLTAINVNPGTQVSGGASFMALQVGPQITVTPTGGGAQALLGFTHYEDADVGHNILARIVSTSPALGGTLGPGTYSIWVQDTGGVVPYNFSFVITAVPEPATVVLAGLGLLGLLAAQQGNKRL